MIQAIILSLIGIVSLVGANFLVDEKVKRIETFGANQKISELTDYTTPLHNDVLPIVDTANGATKKLKWGTATSTLKTLFDTIYSPIFSTSAGLASILSDETGSGGGFVRATSPTLTTPTFDVAGTDATGDIYYNGGSGVMTRLPIGSSNEFLRVSGGLPDWDNTALLTNPQTASSSFTATTSFAATNVNSNALIINGLAYSFPSTRGASSTALTENGSGVLAWRDSGMSSPYNAYLKMSTSSGSGTLVASTTRAGISGVCVSTSPTLVSDVIVWRYGTVAVYWNISTKNANSLTISFSKNGLSTTTFNNSLTSISGGALFNVNPGDHVSVYCTEDDPSADPTVSGPFLLFATSTNGLPQLGTSHSFLQVFDR